jgi:hypothetical protein
MIYIFSSVSENSEVLKRALERDKKNDWAEILPKFPAGGKIKAGDQAYIDITGLSQADLKKTIAQIKKSGAFWGIIDPDGSSEDPASFFFDGASD